MTPTTTTNICASRERRISSSAGIRVHWDQYGSGPPLVLVHGSFSDHVSNWQYVAPMLAERFTVHAIARRGRGNSDATDDHGVVDEGQDVVAVIRSLGEPVFLLGHSYGAHVALAAAVEMPELVRKLILYEPPRPGTGKDALARLEKLGQAGDWDQFAYAFFREVLYVPGEELEGLRASELWPPIVANAPASLADIRAISHCDTATDRYQNLSVPVVLQIGSESPRDFFFTDSLAGVLPDVRIETLDGQAHEGMMTGPEQYADAVKRLLLQ